MRSFYISFALLLIFILLIIIDATFLLFVFFFLITLLFTHNNLYKYSIRVYKVYVNTDNLLIFKSHCYIYIYRC